MIYLLIGISFFLEGIFSMAFPSHSIFSPLFTLVCISLIYPYFRRYDHSFFKICFLAGLFYDVIYTNTLLFHALIFLAIAYLIDLLYRFFEQKLWNLLLITLIVIVCYRFVSYLILVIFFKYSFSWILLWDSIVCSLISNLIYGFLLYLLLNLLKKHQKVSVYH